MSRSPVPWVVLGIVLLSGASVVGQPPPGYSTSGPVILPQRIRDGWLRTSIVSGRISVVGTRSGTTSSSSSGTDRTERLKIQGARTSGSAFSVPTVEYEFSDARRQIFIDISQINRVRFRQSAKNNSDVVPLEFVQAPGKPLSLTVGTAPGQITLEAAGIWHLVLSHPKPCEEHLVPLLAMLRPGWDFLKAVAEVEEELLRIASSERVPDRRRWAALVEQLADQRFYRRETADRQLRESGRAVVVYLVQLDTKRLDAEQRFRVRRIILDLSSDEEDDSPHLVASWLAGDLKIWFALLSRDDDVTRRLAARQLTALLERPLAFDPDAEEATRRTQLEKLRAELFTP
ncbi:MAG: hypothetical protein HQ581_14840 [Planctomycetes bacterium]|nr:hypothetical protein [Planctomycetota bacterium]